MEARGKHIAFSITVDQETFERISEYMLIWDFNRSNTICRLVRLGYVYHKHMESERIAEKKVPNSDVTPGVNKENNDQKKIKEFQG